MANSDGFNECSFCHAMNGSVICSEYGLLTLSPNPFGKTAKKFWPLTTSAMAFY